MFRGAMIVLFGSAVLAAAPAVAPSGLKSTPIAAQLTAALAEQKLDAIAARDPEEADRFVAAMFFPNAQLLVISAKGTNPELLATRLQYKQYRDIYSELQGGAAVKGSSLFFQDMKADGLPAADGQAADILYRGDGTTIVFDGESKRRGGAAEEYRRQLTEADQQYSRFLSLLLAQVKPT